MRNPALEAFVQQLQPELTVAQVLIRRTAGGFELRHTDDATLEPSKLRLVALGDLRLLAQYTEHCVFRPLHAAPNLRRGWIYQAGSEAELEQAMGHLYPGAIADWHAARSPNPPVTHYREFTQRQTGMYRITAMLDDTQAARMIRACCTAQLCLKQRLWTVSGCPTDTLPEKSLIPCLEPCALLLEFARKAMRIEQQDKKPLALAKGEWDTLRAALERASHHPPAEQREADFEAPDNPRRIRLLLEKLGQLES